MTHPFNANIGAQVNIDAIAKVKTKVETKDSCNCCIVFRRKKSRGDVRILQGPETHSRTHTLSVAIIEKTETN